MSCYNWLTHKHGRRLPHRHHHRARWCVLTGLLRPTSRQKTKPPSLLPTPNSPTWPERAANAWRRDWRTERNKPEMKRPSFQFYPADWRKDTALQFCSLPARGLWVEMMCIAHECEPYGHLIVNGRPMTVSQIGRLVGIGEKECGKLLDELFDAGVPSRTEEGAIFSRRMVNDEEIRNRRATGGTAGAEHGAKGGSFGKKGGRPSGKTPPIETPLETPLSEDGRGVIKPPLESQLDPPYGIGQPSIPVFGRRFFPLSMAVFVAWQSAQSNCKLSSASDPPADNGTM